MIRIRLLNNANSELVFAGDLFRKNTDFQVKIGENILPIPKNLEISDEKWIRFSNIINVEVAGDFIPQSSLLKRQNISSIHEPNWNISTFITRLKEWLEENWDHSEIDSLEVNLIKCEPSLNVEFKRMEQFVPSDAWSEAYSLEIKLSEIDIHAWSMRGAYYAILTLAQLARIQERAIYLPICQILDYPDFEIRGLVDDISRGQRPTPENFKKFIRFLSSIKQNVLVLYIEDMFVYSKYPEIGEGRAPLTKELIEELEEYALNHFIEIQPGVEMFGHTDNILLQPSLQKFGEFPGAHCFDVSNPEIRNFVDDLLSEICPAFRSEAFHLICDESYDFGLGKSKKYIAEKGEQNVLAEWYLFLVETVQKYGKKFPTIAHDIISKKPETLKQVQGKIPLILYWKYNDKKEHKEISKLRKAGFIVAGSPAVFDWSRHYPYFDYAEKNIIYMAREGVKRGLVGLVSTKWGDLFNENFRENIYYGLAIQGQASWNVEAVRNGAKKDFNTNKVRRGFLKLFFNTFDYRLMEIMDILNKQNRVLPSFPNGMFNRYWMDPYVREIKPKEYKQAQRFIHEAVKILETLNQLRTGDIIKKNQDNLDYIEFAARMALHYGVKILTSEAAFKQKLSLVLDIPPILSQLSQSNLIPKYEGEKMDIQTDLIPLFQWLSVDIQDQQEKYAGLWTRIAMEEGLEYPLRRFEILNWHYLQSIDALTAGQQVTAHQLQARWIWCQGFRITSYWGNQKEFFFYKKFQQKTALKRALLQGIAANHMVLYLNGSLVGEVLSRFSLGQLSLAKSVQWFDITELLQSKGENVLAVQAANWTRGLGGINIVIHLEYETGESEDIITDESWLYSDTIPQNWPLPTKAKWRKAKSRGTPPGAWMGPITQPIWDNNWKSEISFSFGLRNFIETGITTAIPVRLYKLLFFLFPMLTRLIGVDIFNFRT